MQASTLLVLAIALVGCASSNNLPPTDAGARDSGPDAQHDAGPDGFFTDCLSDLPDRVDTRVHRFRSDDGRFEIVLVSAAPADYCVGGNLCACNGGSCGSYEMLRFGVLDDGEGVCLREVSELDYQGGHHSWGEVATATSDTTRYVVRMMFSFDTNTYTDSLELRDPVTDALLGTAFPLVSEDCYAIPAGTNQGCCERCQTRERSDD
ncbi:MAG: hypothetical protein IPG17_18180 [Sandaracinaceae bacterium]|jgi:hypothetical protein|nr:hypothetical protein [Sandaracinaceae bacterium]MBP7682752.1 hypothetical protein [Deltaproteobacteria bacterium]MBK6811439.1 hypothetical protein [Sandaracinaceae bacterium]MBK7156838.1 hypothetical protein [Sandaracinaceae bacterium]MBK7777499.1 hypothetical protein [Sandaracinaceae bacterium]